MHTDGEESHAIVMKAQIQSGDVSNPKNIEESTESARTGILSANTMVSGIVHTRISVVIRVGSIRANCVRPGHIGHVC